MKQQKISETDLYPPVRDFLLALGYDVQAEVDGCDVVAKLGEQLLIVELKLSFNTTLLVQATDRQRMADLVYVALPRPTSRAWRQRWPGYQHLLRRLELGLMLVSFGTNPPLVEVVFDPKPFSQRHQKKRRQRVMAELAGRSRAYNQGGSNRRKLMTAYREAALIIAKHLALAEGPLSPKALRDSGASRKTGDILYGNYYGWFTRIDHGLYTLSDAGRLALTEYKDIVEQLPIKKEGDEA
ncbi:MAG TPA: hypothetical protein DDZ53_11065 [Firmicutes bacterium]|nr:hypothetical protein [Bacillota bacterium]